MLHKKVFHVNKKKVDVAQKSISCRQKQDDAASKKCFWPAVNRDLYRSIYKKLLFKFSLEKYF